MLNVSQLLIQLQLLNKRISLLFLNLELGTSSRYIWLHHIASSTKKYDWYYKNATNRVNYELTFLLKRQCLPSRRPSVQDQCPYSGHSSLCLSSCFGHALVPRSSRQGRMQDLGDSGDRLGKQASDILSSKLSATGKFMMFERSDKYSMYVDNRSGKVAAVNSRKNIYISPSCDGPIEF